MYKKAIYLINQSPRALVYEGLSQTTKYNKHNIIMYLSLHKIEQPTWDSQSRAVFTVMWLL
jgi:hypothetical protein